MLKKILFCVVLLSFSSALAFYGARAQQAEMRFSAEVDIEWGEDPSLSLMPQKQVDYLLGHLQSTGFKKVTGFVGTLSDRQHIQIVSVQNLPHLNLQRIRYEFTGMAIFDKKAFQPKQQVEIPFLVPKQPDTFYEQIFLKWGFERGNALCTDDHYNGDVDFFYFWDIGKKGCPLQQDTSLLYHGKAHLTARPNTELTYPNYKELYGDNGNGTRFDVSIIVGYIGDHNQLRRPNRQDIGYGLFREIEKDLVSMGFDYLTPKNRQAGFRIYRDGRRVPGINFLHEYARGDVHVKVYLMDTSVSTLDYTYQYYMQEIFRDSDVVYYDGHASTGTYFDSAAIPDLSLNPFKHQIFILNGCSTYYYVGSVFFEQKGGSATLDVITAGLVTLTTNSMSNFHSFLDGFFNLKTLSYQTILNRVERAFVDKGDYLINVSGDEDNRWKPTK